MSNFERRFGKYAIRNISLVLILCYLVGYIIQMINANFLLFLTLDPYRILHGQIWRLVTWLIVPPSSLGGSPMNILFTGIMLLFYYNIGTSLERTWGTYRYNVYLVTGMLFTIVASFLSMGLMYLLSGGMNSGEASMIFSYASLLFSTYYINLSIFLAFAATYPDVQVLLMFVIPVKMKWLGILEAVLIVYEFIFAGNLFTRFAIGAAVLNFAVFYLRSKSFAHISPKQVKRRAEFKQQVKKSTSTTTHKCAICGRTEKDDATLEFRYCSKCNGNYEYCQHHLFTHEHVK